MRELETGAIPTRAGKPWATLSPDERREEIDSRRLAYLADVTVNWCPKLGTVLSNEEVTAEGRSERGDHPVYKRPLKQWMMRITAYTERLAADLDLVDWPESVRLMQRNWIGRSEGAWIEFEVLGTPSLRDGSPRSGGPSKAGSRHPAAADLKDVSGRFAAERHGALHPIGFVPRDPYPPGIFGPVRDLVTAKRFLPHLHLPGATYFVTWKALEGEELSPAERDAVLGALLHFDGSRCRVYAAAVMSNHVHWIVRPFEGHSLDQLVESVKHFSATQINKSRGRRGHFWAPERFDHIIRDEAYFNEFVEYVVQNPVEAGVVTRPAEYPWVFVHREALGELAASRRSVAERRGTQEAIRVFTTRPDTVFGATYMVLSPEHPLVDSLTMDAWPSGVPAKWKGTFPGAPAPGFSTPRDAVAAYRRYAESKSDVQRTEAKEKTGVFIGAYATNPGSGKPIPIFIADYVLMGYGTGAIMAVPGQDERDWEFAEQHDVPIVRTVQPPADWKGKAYLGDGPAINSGFLDGLGVADAKKRIAAWLAETGRGEPTVTYKLRDWLFSRQRYWGEPFPIVFDDRGVAHNLPEAMLPVLLPELADFTPTSSDDPDAPPTPPLGRAKDWVHVELDLGEGKKRYRRETNTMPNWAGSCWYYLRYLDPDNERAFCDGTVERFWMAGIPPSAPRASGQSPVASRQSPSGGVDLYVGGVEHAVLHLLYARFWHKVLYDLGYVSTPEPFQKLFNQGYIQAAAYRDERGVYVEASEVEERGGRFFHNGKPVAREFGKMGKSLKNAVGPDDINREYGCDTLRVYEMSMGPLEASKPWNTRDIVGAYRFLQRVWRHLIDEKTGRSRVTDAEPDAQTLRLLHKTIKGVRQDFERLAFNTPVSKLIVLNDHLGSLAAIPKVVARDMILMLAPYAPHLAEELWERCGFGSGSQAYEPFPVSDDRLADDDVIELPVSINGKVRGHIRVAADADAKAVEAAALAEPKVQEHVAGKTVKKVIVVPKKMVNVVVG